MDVRGGYGDSMKRLISIAMIFSMSVALTTSGEVSASPQNHSILNTRIPQPIRKAPVAEVIRALADDVRIEGLIGFQVVPGDATVVGISSGSSLGEALRTIVQQDHRYRIAATKVPEIVNLIGRPDDADAKLLEAKISRCDIVLDDWPQNWFMRLPELCPEVSSQLGARYKQLGGGSFETAGPGASMEGNVTPPHLEMHITDKSLRDILNTLAVRSMTVTNDSSAKARPGTVAASGWKYSIPAVNSMDFYVWQRRVFSGL